jgi:hypothetical protein
MTNFLCASNRCAGLGEVRKVVEEPRALSIEKNERSPGRKNELSNFEEGSPCCQRMFHVR